MGGGGEAMKNLQWGADRTRKKYPAYGKFHKKLSLHCSKGVGSPQTLKQEREQQ